jgi:hypothetical protein
MQATLTLACLNVSVSTRMYGQKYVYFVHWYDLLALSLGIYFVGY